MASAQVLPSSRKQEHLAAGKRRLEEFRKKKAADRTKKSSSSNGNNVTPSERQPSDSQLIIPANSVGASRQSSTSEIMDREFDNSQRSEQNPEFLINDTTNMFSGSSSHMPAGDKDCNYSFEVLSSNGLVDHSIDHETAATKGDSAISEGTSCDLTSVHDFKGNEETLEAFRPSSIKGFGPDNGQVMLDVAISDASQKSNIDERKLASSSSGWPEVQNLAPYTQPQYSSTSYSSNYSKSSDHTTLYPQKSEAQPRRSRPSFLDSLNVPKGSSLALPDNYVGSRESISGNEAKICTDSRGESAIGTPYTDNLSASVTAVSNGKHFPDAGEHSVEKKPEFYQLNQDEDFFALEQHIEDLTQEKFSLQRALEASRALAESLASENSSLTDSYNQQRSAVNQLKADMENLREQLSKQLVELESLKHEYMNAQLECNAADERAKLLASEVIGLEEKALRLRSSELKLERQLENSQAEIASFKKKVSGLDKERLDLQSTISSLQEEKKLLQSKLRKSSGGNSIEARENSDNKKDMSTSTDDLETGASIYTSSQQMEHSLSIAKNGASASISLSDNFHSNPEASFAYIPPDQLRMIESISAIISELTLEKEELVKSLASVISDNSNIKDLNKELSQKLEAQTQRLELLTAQSMANDGILAKHPNPSAVLDNATYADEGDEVVERVLGWIMKLFPGGPSRRRTSKLL